VKAAAADFVRDPRREAAMLRRLEEAAREKGLDSFFVGRLFRQILDHSVRFQTDHLVGHHDAERAGRPLTVAYQGTEGAYSHVAAQHHFEARRPGPHHAAPAYQGCTTFREALEAVEAGAADVALLPIENTTAGSINEVYDLLSEKRLWLVGEEVLKVEHCLLALQQVPLTHIRRIASHPQALAQCSRFLARQAHVRVESYADTAMAARRLLEERDLSAAAIAGEEAARLYGLEVIARDVANQEGNFTRFVAVAREPVRPDLRVPCKTSLAFVTLHEQGALARCLAVLAEHGLNLTKLESRPLYGSAWKYLFYADFEGNAADPRVDAALSDLEPLTRQLRVLGSYPASVANGGGGG
jgi:chorismate mutase/prephenate dehydratase